MTSRFNHIGVVLMLALLLCAESCQRTTIPMRTMKRIYSDMFIADASLEFKPDLYLGVDSLAVYPAIFEKYGYTTEQFLETQEYLISHPDKFSKLVEQMKNDWDSYAKVAEAEIAVRDSLADIEYEKQQAIQTAIDNFMDSISFACLLDTIVVRCGDSTGVAAPVKRVPVRDTIIPGE